MTRFAVGIIWLLHFLPLPVQAWFGRCIGDLLFAIARSRRHIALTNLRLCFPKLTPAQQQHLARENFRMIARSFVERGIAWWSSPERICKLVRVKGREHLEAHAGKPVILLAPHFAGLDLGGTRITIEWNCVSMYSRQKNVLINRLLLHGRTRFRQQIMLSRQEGLRPAIRAIKDGNLFYYLPDMDLGARDALFVPFFGIPAATVPALSRLAKLTGAKVIPCITRMLPNATGYEVELSAPWDNFPTEDLEADTQRMNAFIEQIARDIPEQYYWVHRRFKTRPPGGTHFYSPASVSAEVESAQ